MSNVGTYDPSRPRNGSGPRLKNWSLKLAAPTFIGAILPPFKSLKDSNAIAQYWSIIWLTDSRGKKRPVPSIERKKDRKVIQPDPILERAAAMNSIIANSEAAGENPEVIKQMKERISSLDPDKNYHLNVIAPDGQIGTFRIRYTCYQALEAKLKELDSKGIKAIGPNSLFFEFKRWKDAQGKTMYSVDVATEYVRNPQTGGVSPSYKSITIDENIISRMENEAADLSKMFEYQTVENQALLASLDPTVISRVLMKSRPDDDRDDEPADTPSNPVGYSAPPTSVSQPTTTLSSVTTAVQTPLAATQPVSVPTPEPVAAPSPSVSSQLGAQAGGGIPDDVKRFLLFNQPGGQAK